MWKMGPECAAQQQKKVSASTTNCGERNAWATVRPAPPVAAPAADAAVSAAAAGGRRTSSAAGITRAQATSPTVVIAVRQS